MNDRETLLRAICADPADTLTRAAFADYLDESGAPAERAAFVRKSLTMIATIFCFSKRPNCRERLDLDGAPWAVINRGFMTEIGCQDSFWLEHGSNLMAQEPIVWAELSNRRPRRGKFGRRPGWELSEKRYWIWTLQGSLAAERKCPDNVIHREIFRWLRRGLEPFNEGGYRQYRSRKEAMVAMSQALLSLGKASQIRCTSERNEQ